MSSFSRLATLLLLALSNLIVPQASAVSEAEKAASKGILLFNNGTEPQGLDPHTVTGIPEHKILSAIMEGLVSEHPTSDTEVMPGVAETWETSADGRTWTFHLRENARWSNGDKVTSADFLYAYRRILNPAFGAKYVNMLFPMEGAEDYATGRNKDFESVGVKGPDEHTLVIRLRGPLPYLPQLLKHYTWFPLHKPTLEKFDAFERRGTAWTQPENFVGNGPFALATWQVNKVLTVTRSPTYWDTANVKLSGIHYLPIENRDTENNAFEAGQLHVTDSVPLAVRRKLFEGNEPSLRRDRQFSTAYLLFNTKRPNTGNVDLRRALSLAIDRQTITEELLLSGEAAYAFTPPGVSGYEAPDAVGFDPEAARAALAKAGFPGGTGLPKLTASITTSDTTRILAEALQAMWRKELGIEVELRNMEWKVLIDTLDQRDYDISFLVWYGDYVDPQTFLELMITGSGNNRTEWSSPRYDKLVNEALVTVDLKQRFALLNEAETLLLQDMPISPIYWMSHNFRVSPLVNGYGPKLLDQRPWKHISLKGTP